jgi:hypothetical protein
MGLEPTTFCMAKEPDSALYTAFCLQTATFPPPTGPEPITVDSGRFLGVLRTISEWGSDGWAACVYRDGQIADGQRPSPLRSSARATCGAAHARRVDDDVDVRDRLLERLGGVVDDLVGAQRAAARDWRRSQSR